MPEGQQWPPVDLKRHCSCLGNALRCLAISPHASARDPWERHACSSSTCVEREHRAFHGVSNSSLAEHFAGIFGDVTRPFALGRGQFIGRTITVDLYSSLLDEHGVAPGHALRELLVQLGNRGRIVGYKGLADLDGVHGWLDPPETKELAGALITLPLPQHDASFESMEALLAPGKHGPCEARGVPFLELSLSFVRTVATIASAEDKGILWLNR